MMENVPWIWMTYSTYGHFHLLYSVRFLLEFLDKRVKGPKTSQKQWGFPIFDMGTPFFWGGPPILSSSTWRLHQQKIGIYLTINKSDFSMKNWKYSSRAWVLKYQRIEMWPFCQEKHGFSPLNVRWLTNHNGDAMMQYQRWSPGGFPRCPVASRTLAVKWCIPMLLPGCGILDKRRGLLWCGLL